MTSWHGNASRMIGPLQGNHIFKWVEFPRPNCLIHEILEWSLKNSVSCVWKRMWSQCLRNYISKSAFANITYLTADVEANIFLYKKCTEHQPECCYWPMVMNKVWQMLWSVTHIGLVYWWVLNLAVHVAADGLLAQIKSRGRYQQARWWWLQRGIHVVIYFSKLLWL